LKRIKNGINEQTENVNSELTTRRQAAAANFTQRIAKIVGKLQKCQFPFELPSRGKKV